MRIYEHSHIAYTDVRKKLKERVTYTDVNMYVRSLQSVYLCGPTVQHNALTTVVDVTCTYYCKGIFWYLITIPQE